MEQNPVDESTELFLATKKTGLLYSLFLAVGSVSLFTSLVALNTAYQGVIWSYSTSYIMNSLALAFVLFLGGILFVASCVQLVRKKYSARLYGLVGTVFLIGYSLFALFINSYISYTLTYMLILLVLFFVIVGVGVLLLRRKRS